MKLWNLALCALLAAVALPCHGQGFRMSALRPQFGLLLKPAVEKELRVTPAQRDKIRAALGGLLVNGGKAMRLDANTDLSKLDKDTQAVLTPAQRTRLYQIWLQKQDALALASSTVAQEVGLTAPQKREVERVYDDYEDKLQAAARNATHEGGVLRLDTAGIQKETVAQLRKVLTPAQAAKFKKMQGPKFHGDL